MGAKKRRTARAEEVASEKEIDLKESAVAGREYGRGKFQQLFGTDEGEVGDMMSSALDSVEASRGRYSQAGDQIRQQANRQAMIARQRGGQMGAQTAAQQAQIGTQASTQAAGQRFKEEQYAEHTYRNVASALASNSVSLEQAYGAQKLAEVRPLSEFDMPRSGFFG